MSDADTYDSAAAISAARKYTLAIIALAALAVQIGWMERERLDRMTLFAYFDKTLTVYELLSKESPEAISSNFEISLTTLGPDAAPIAILGAGEDNPLALLRRVMVDATFSEVAFPGRTDELMTLTDPAGSCTARVFRGDGQGRFLANEYSSLNRHQRFSQTRWIDAAQSYPVLFGRNCVFQLESNEPVLLYLHSDGSNWGVVLPRGLVRLGDFPGAHQARQTREDFLFFNGEELSATELSLFDGIESPIAQSFRVETVSAFILESATRIGGKAYAPGQWREALGELVKSQAAAPTVLGITLPPQLAVLFMPLALLLLSVTVLHRVRRIRSAEEREPWILLQPEGIVEWISLAIWVLALLAAPTALLWAGQIYDPGGFEWTMNNAQALVTGLQVVDPYTAQTLTWTENGAALIRSTIAYSIVIAVAAQLLIAISVIRVFELNGIAWHRQLSDRIATVSLLLLNQIPKGLEGMLRRGAFGEGSFEARNVSQSARIESSPKKSHVIGRKLQRRLRKLAGRNGIVILQTFFDSLNEGDYTLPAATFRVTHEKHIETIQRLTQQSFLQNKHDAIEHYRMRLIALVVVSDVRARGILVACDTILRNLDARFREDPDNKNNKVTVAEIAVDTALPVDAILEALNYLSNTPGINPSGGDFPNAPEPYVFAGEQSSTFGSLEPLVSQLADWVGNTAAFPISFSEIGGPQSTKFDEALSSLKNHGAIAWILVGAVAVTGLSALVAAIAYLVSLFQALWS